MKKRINWKQLTALSLCGAMLMSMAACGKETKQPANNSLALNGDFVYVPEFTDLKKNDESYISGSFFKDGSLYFLESSYDEEAVESHYEIRKVSGDQAGESESVLTVPEGKDVYQWFVDSEEQIYLLFSEWSEDGENQSWELCKISGDQNVVFDEDITGTITASEEDAYLSNIAVDDKGRIYLASDEKVYLFDDHGKTAGIVNVDGYYINCMASGSNGEVYISYYSEKGSVLALVDFDKKGLGKSLTSFPDCNRFVVCRDGRILAFNNNSLFLYDPETESKGTLLKWLDCDINGDYVQNVSGAENDGVIVYLSDWDQNSEQIITFRKTDASQVEQKETITIGVTYTDQNLMAATVAFNKSNPKYRVTIKSYYEDLENGDETEWEDMLKMINNEIISGNAPDLIELSMIDPKDMVNKGVLEDLNSYLEKSSKVHKSDFIDGLLDAYTQKGVLTGIPRSVYLFSLVGKTENVGEKIGWTLDDLMELSEKHPDAQLFNGMSKGDVLTLCMMFNESSFVDWENAECHFDTPEFTRVLEFVNKFPDEVDWDNYDDSSKLYQEDKILLQMGSISEFQDVQYYGAMFNAPVTFVGFPTIDEKGGTAIMGDGAYGISASSSNKEAAWEFIEFYLTYENSWYDFGIPSFKERLEERIKSETEPEYEYDENGEILLDENGEPVESNSFGGSVMDESGWEYEYHKPSQEDIDLVLSLLEDITLISDMSGDEMTKIIEEEAEPYFRGQKSAEDVANIIQRRLQNYVSENS